LDAKNRQVAHTKLDSKIGICVEKFPDRRICGAAKAARTTNKGAVPVYMNVYGMCVPYVRVCVL